jgi:hypothetical protein
MKVEGLIFPHFSWITIFQGIAFAYYILDVIRMIKLRRMRPVAYIARMVYIAYMGG